MYKDLEEELKKSTGEPRYSLVSKLASDAFVQYNQVDSIFEQPIALREMVLYFAFKRSKLSPALYMAKLEKSVQKALEEKLKAKLTKLQKKK